MTPENQQINRNGSRPVNTHQLFAPKHGEREQSNIIITHWNAEVFYNKKTKMEILMNVKGIRIRCIQETHQQVKNPSKSDVRMYSEAIS